MTHGDVHLWPTIRDGQGAHETSLACWCVPRLNPVPGSTAYVVEHNGTTADDDHARFRQARRLRHREDRERVIVQADKRKT